MLQCEGAFHCEPFFFHEGRPTNFSFSQEKGPLYNKEVDTFLPSIDRNHSKYIIYGYSRLDSAISNRYSFSAFRFRLFDLLFRQETNEFIGKRYQTAKE